MKKKTYWIAGAVLLVGTLTVMAFSSFKKEADRAVITTIYDVSGNVIATAPSGNVHWRDENTMTGFNAASIVTSAGTTVLYSEPTGTVPAYFRP